MDFSNETATYKEITEYYDAKIEDFRFAVQLIINGHPKCGGTLITDKHVLTAVHCLYEEGKLMDINKLLLIIGNYDKEKNSNWDVQNYYRRANMIIKHSGYNPRIDNDFDIAIIELFEPVPLGRFLRAAILPPHNSPLLTGTPCNAWGWGKVKSSEDSYRTVLRHMKIPVLPINFCKLFQEFDQQNTLFCAEQRYNENSCIESTGGSLLVRIENSFVVAGIASFGMDCGLMDLPGFYTDVSKFTSWIYDKTTDATCRPRIFPKEKYPVS